MRSLISFLLAVCITAPVQAAWRLDNESSRLTFITSKNTNITEVNRFLLMRGHVDEQGQAELRIDMDSLRTGIPLRDERLREQLFESHKYPEARVTARLDLRAVSQLANGAQQEMQLPVRLELLGRTREYRSEMLVTRLDEHRFQVVSLSPLLLNAQDFGLTEKLDALRQLAGLKNISLSVPVSTVLIFVSP